MQRQIDGRPPGSVTYRWDQSGIPQKGWVCIDVIDVGADGPIEDTDYESCEMCSNEKIRYVHIMEHPNYPRPLRVGCVCSGKMSGDYQGARQREVKLSNRAKRRVKWLQRTWRLSGKGNEFLNVQGKNLGVRQKGSRWTFWANGQFSTKSYSSSDEAKLALFVFVWPKPTL